MKDKRYFLSVFLILSVLFLTTPKILLFYDAPEYVNIISKSSFLKSLSLGHPPIHPSFIGTLWIVSLLLRQFFGISLEFSANLSAFIFGLCSILLFLKISKAFLKKNQSYLATTLFSLFPAVWIINTNLMVESLSLTLFLLSVLLFLKFLEKQTGFRAFFYMVSIILLLSSHVQMLIWLPALFALPLLFQDKKRKAERRGLTTLFFLTSIGFFLSILIFVVIFLLAGKPLLFEVKQLFFGRVFELFDLSNVFYFILRSSRNIFLEVFRGFGSLTGFLISCILFSKRNERFFLFGTLLFGISLCISGSVWTGDFMIRRIVFAGVFFALILARYLSFRVTFLLMIYLMPITFANVLLYLSEEDMPLVQMRKAESNLPAGNVLIQTHYVRPFTHNYNGNLLWVGEDDLKTSENFLEDEKKIVFMDSQALFVPYLLYVGNNLHITSLSKFGVSETKTLFDKYVFDLAKVGDPGKRIFIFSARKEGGDFGQRIDFNRRLVNNKTSLIVGSAQPGSSVFIYSKNFFQRIHRERIDYGDLFTWAWVILTKKHDPMIWTYADKDGVFIFPINASEKEKVYVTGENIKKTFILSNEGIVEIQEVF